MANTCFFDIRIKGKKKNVIRVSEWINASTLNFNLEQEAFEKANLNKEIVAEGRGECKWSCRLNFEDGPNYVAKTTLKDFCLMQDVEAEIFSCEPMNGFAEHIYIGKDGHFVYEQAKYMEKDIPNEDRVGTYCALIEGGYSPNSDFAWSWKLK